MYRLTSLSVLVMTLCSISICGQRSFEGKWLVKEDRTKLSPEPVVFSIKNGLYTCSSCTPQLTVKADGQDQPVKGRTYDTISVRVIDANTVSITTKKGAHVVSEQTRTVSDDGKKLSLKHYSAVNVSEKKMILEVTATRLKRAPVGAHRVSGAWREVGIRGVADAATTTIARNGDELTVTNAEGESFTAKLDGHDYPSKGTTGYDSVRLTLFDQRTLEEIDKLGDKVTSISRYTLSADEKMLTIQETDMPSNRTFTAVLERQ